MKISVNFFIPCCLLLFAFNGLYAQTNPLRLIESHLQTGPSVYDYVKPSFSIPNTNLNSIGHRPAGTSVPAIEWHKCLGSNYGDYANSIQATSDGGYIIAGYTDGADNGDVMGHHGNASVGDIWIVKIDKNGNIEWQKSYGGVDSEQGASILQTPDGGYVVAAAVASNECGIVNLHSGFDYWILKLNAKGDLMWQKVYGGTQEDLPGSIALSPDGGYFVAGHTLSKNGDVTVNHGASDYWIIKIDANGNLVWQKSLGGSDYDDATSVQATPDGGCIVAGTTASVDGDVTGNHGSSDYWIVKLDNKGNVQWEKTLGGSTTENAGCIQLTKDGGYIVSGSSNSINGDVTGNHAGSYDSWIVKLDANGKIAWQRCYGGSSNETANYIQLTTDGGYVFTGTSLSSDGDVSCNAGQYDVLVMKINSTGQLEWQKTIGGKDNEEGYCVQSLANGSFIIAGYTNSPDIAGYHTPATSGFISDYFIIKLSAPLSSVPNPVVTIDPASTTACATGKATVKATVLYGGLTPIYQWTKNGAAVGTNSASYTDLNFSANDQVACSVTNVNTCDNNSLKGSDKVLIKVNSNPVSPAIKISANNTSACNCTTITIRASVSNPGGAPDYQWALNGNYTGNTADIFISNNLKDGDVITCAYADNAICSISGFITSNAIKIGAAGGNPLSVNIAVPNDTICKDAVANFTASAVNAGSNPTFQWKVNGVNAGANSSVFTSSSLANGDIVSCSIKADPLFTCATATSASSNSVVMHVANSGAPAVSIAANPEIICAGSTATCTATAVNAGTNPVFQWKINGKNVGQNDRTYTSSIFANNDVINCTIKTDQQNACALSSEAVSADIVLKVNNGALPTIDISASGNNSCAGETITVVAQAHDAGTSPVYQWILNNTLLAEQSPTFGSNALSNGDRLFCKILPGAGACSSAADSSNIVIIQVNDTPFVKMIPLDTTIAYGGQVQLKPSVIGNVASFQWSSPEKLVSPLSLVTQTVSLVENTGFTVSVINDKGCKATATATIKIFTALYMPRAFTPNNDGVNDLFRIPPITIVTLKEFTIYNRWGSKVFTTKNKADGWDGTINGKKQNTGSYIYYIRYIANNIETFLKGDFILIR